MTLVSLVSVTADPASAAETLDKGTFDYGSTSWSCGTGTNQWTCTYSVSIRYYDVGKCSEAEVNTGTGVDATVRCEIELSASALIVPILSARGTTIGCTSVVGTGSGTLTYTSHLNNGWSNDIPLDHVEIRGTGSVGSGTVAFQGARVNVERNYAWDAEGTLAGSCGKGTSGSGNSASGDVTVQYMLQ